MNSFSSAVEGWCSLHASLSSATPFPSRTSSCAYAYAVLFSLTGMASSLLPPHAQTCSSPSSAARRAPFPPRRGGSALDERLQPAERLVPLPGDGVERLARLQKLPRAQLPHALASAAGTANQPRARPHPGGLGGRLAGHPRGSGEPPHRPRTAAAQAGAQGQTRPRTAR